MPKSLKILKGGNQNLEAVNRKRKNNTMVKTKDKGTNSDLLKHYTEN